MRTELQIIQSALNDFEFLNYKVDNQLQCKFFKILIVPLPTGFKGLPPNWRFSILLQQGDESHKLDSKQEIIEEGNTLISFFQKERELPMVIISDDARLNVQTELSDGGNFVFFLDKYKLGGKVNKEVSVRSAPIILAAKAKLERQNRNYPLQLSPYSPNIPVEGWQFFGRRKELSQIVTSKSNCFILGARKTGKSSILREACRVLEEMGYNVHDIGVQYAANFGEVVNALVTKLSSRDAYYAHRNTSLLETNFVVNVIRRLKGENRKNIVFVFDELGNVMRKDPRNAWNFMGVLRDLSHKGEIRILASAFQEVYIRTYKDLESPLLNFGSMIQINLFSRPEVEELLIDPLSVWYEIDDRTELLSLIRKKFGFHPLILQYVGEYVFKNIFNSNDKKVINYINKILEDDIDIFEQAFREIFEMNHSLLERCIFLTCCRDAKELRQELSTIEVRQGILNQLLEKLNIQSTLEERNYFLFRLSLKGLFYQDPANNLIFKIATPILYYYFEAHNDVNETLVDLEAEIMLSVKDIKIEYQNEGS